MSRTKLLGKGQWRFNAWSGVEVKKVYRDKTYHIVFVVINYERLQNLSHGVALERFALISYNVVYTTSILNHGLIPPA